MKKPKCSKCECENFAMSQINLNGSKHDMMAVYCENCGCIITITETSNVSAKIDKLEKYIMDNILRQ